RSGGRVGGLHLLGVGDTDLLLVLGGHRRGTVVLDQLHPAERLRRGDLVLGGAVGGRLAPAVATVVAAAVGDLLLVVPLLVVVAVVLEEEEATDAYRGDHHHDGEDDADRLAAAATTAGRGRGHLAGELPLLAGE